MNLKVFIKSTIILFISACLLHFLYEWTNYNVFIGFVSPINESIFEHTKLVLVPLIIFYFVYYFRNKHLLDINKYIFTMLLSIILGVLIVPMLYYFYTQSFNIESLFIDISITYFAFLISNLFFYSYYKFNNIYIRWKLSLFFILLIYLFYIYATLYIIDIPIFIS